MQVGHSKGQKQHEPNRSRRQEDEVARIHRRRKNNNNNNQTQKLKKKKKNTQKNYTKKYLNVPDNQGGVITHLSKPSRSAKSSGP